MLIGGKIHHDTFIIEKEKSMKHVERSESKRRGKIRHDTYMIGRKNSLQHMTKEENS
jgi:hypothetical protein